MGIVVTSDMRKYLPPRDRICNLSALRPLILDHIPLGEAKEHLVKVAQKTAQWKRNYSGLGTNLSLWPLRFLPHFLLRRIMKLIFLSGGGMTGLTNLGPIDDTKLDFGSGPCLDAVLLPPVGVPPLGIGGVSGCKGKLTIGLSYRTPCISQEKIEALFVQIDREIQNLEF